jgi:hypothetical protein
MGRIGLPLGVAIAIIFAIMFTADNGFDSQEANATMFDAVGITAAHEVIGLAREDEFPTWMVGGAGLLLVAVAVASGALKGNSNE